MELDFSKKLVNLRISKRFSKTKKTNKQVNDLLDTAFAYIQPGWH